MTPISKSLGLVAASALGLALLFFMLATVSSPELYAALGMFGGAIPNSAVRQLAWDGGDRLELDLPADVTLVAAGGAPGMIVRGDPDAVQAVMLSDGTLTGKKIRRCMVPMICGENSRLTVELHGVTLHEINVEGSGDVHLGEIHQDRLALTIQGSGDVSGSGEADALSVTIEGSGDARVGKLASKSLTVELEGSGDLQAGTTQKADISLTGSGDVHLAGAMPVDINAHIKGSGTITDSEGHRITRRSQKRMRQT